MSKFNIKVESFYDGEIWVDVKNFVSYLFFSDEFIKKYINAERLQNLKDKHDNVIATSFVFGHFELSKSRNMRTGRAERGGFALKTNLNMFGGRGYGQGWPIKELEALLLEPVLSQRKWETVIVIKMFGVENKKVFKGKENFNENFEIKIEYKVLKRAPALRMERWDKEKYDYYETTNLKNIEDIPFEKDKDSRPYDYLKILPYTKETHDRLKQIIDAGGRLGTELKKILESGKFIDSGIKLLGMSKSKKKSVRA